MAVTIIKGYKLEGTKQYTFKEIENILADFQDMIAIQGKKLYTKLLAEEIEELTDDVALNVIKRPERSIYDAAVDLLDARIGDATGRNLPLRFNLGVQAAIFTLKEDVYIKINVQNEELAKAIKPIFPLAEYSLTDEQNEANKGREKVWSEISLIYSKGNEPAVKRLFPTGPIQPEWKQISAKFSSREKRAEIRVRRQLTGQLLNAIGMNREIPPYKLLPYLDEALGMLGNPGIREDAKRMQEQLLTSIINITEEECKRDPNDIPKTFEE